MTIPCKATRTRALARRLMFAAALSLASPTVTAGLIVAAEADLTITLGAAGASSSSLSTDSYWAAST